MIKKYGLFTAALVATLICALLVVFNQKNRIDPEQPLSLIEGNTVKLKQLTNNKETFIVFWATSCSSCMQELPKIETEKNKTNTFNVIAVAMQYDDIEKIKKYVYSKNYTFSFVYDHDGSIAKKFDDVKLTPTTFKIDKDGVIEKKIVGDIHEF